MRRITGNREKLKRIPRLVNSEDVKYNIPTAILIR